jgi:hypothetical protein
MLYQRGKAYSQDLRERVFAAPSLSGDERHQRCPHSHQAKCHSNSSEIGAHRSLQPRSGQDDDGVHGAL